MGDSPDWIPWEIRKWMVATQYMDGPTEFVFYRLCLVAYEQGDSTITGSSFINAPKCKVTVEEYEKQLGILQEMGKVEKQLGGVYVPSCDKRLQEANGRIEARRIGAAKSRRIRDLKQEGRSSSEISLIIKKEFPDHQAPIKKDKQKERQTDTIDKLGGVPVDVLDECFSEWNALAKRSDHLPTVQMESLERKKALAKRLKECGGIDGWREALRLVEASPFLTGKKTSFKATFDWVTKKANFIKIMEGNYPPDVPSKDGLAAIAERLQNDE